MSALSGPTLIAAAGLCGAAGVALSAAAAHVGGGNLGTAANFLLMHAPALLAIGLLGQRRSLTIAGYVLLLGMALFCGDLVARETIGQRLFPMAAPAGGILMILGWLAIAVAGFAERTAGPR
ncbi:DUF423 domain-containing protein [Mesorhizobium sp. CAU 1732]|uniref:DUF423 domain-containing protein n=1 Tax=Mesorhizobium sp. CAU 1732 TaxID=3140358 RepID=UPI003260AFA3